MEMPQFLLCNRGQSYWLSFKYGCPGDGLWSFSWGINCFTWASQNRKNGLKSWNLKFVLWKTTRLRSTAGCLLEGRQLLSSGSSKGRVTQKKRYAGTKVELQTRMQRKRINLGETFCAGCKVNQSDAELRLLLTWVQIREELMYLNRTSILYLAVSSAEEGCAQWTCSVHRLSTNPRFEKGYYLEPSMILGKNVGYHHLSTYLVQPNLTCWTTLPATWRKCEDCAIPWLHRAKHTTTTRKGRFTSDDAQPVNDDFMAWRLNQRRFSIPFNTNKLTLIGRWGENLLSSLARYSSD